MNPVEIEEAITNLAQKPFDAGEFPFAFLEAFGNKSTTIKRLRKGDSNKSDIDGLLQSGNIHIKTCDDGQTSETIRMLRESSATTNSRNRLKFILATDGITLEAEDLVSGEPPIACDYMNFPNQFGYFLPLAGISTVRQIQESSFDIKATGRLNRLYLELLKKNPDWGTESRRHDLNHFMARLIFCYFAEDTDIFAQKCLFTSMIETMSSSDGSNVQEIIGELFRAMNTKSDERASSGIARWANDFPYVNGGLFTDHLDVPQFNQIGRSYLLNIGHLDWKKINPDIFGSMIQAIADEKERSSLGMHYTSVPNIMKVLNPLFLDELRGKLEDAGTNAQKLLNLRNRISEILIFDPACGSGNFLVIAYKEMRDIEAEINNRLGEATRRSEVSLRNFRGIEQRDFPAEIARLALIIAQYQCDVIHCGQKDALHQLLPLDEKNWITCGNALRLDWFDLLDVEGSGVKIRASDLFDETKKQAAVSFEKKVSEIYICGNPPYLGSTWQSAEQRTDLQLLFQGHSSRWRTLDYVTGWFLKAAEFTSITDSMAAFVSTNSICQGQQVSILWPVIFGLGNSISFAHTSFKWRNLAAHNAGVSVVIVGISCNANAKRKI